MVGLPHPNNSSVPPIDDKVKGALNTLVRKEGLPYRLQFNPDLDRRDEHGKRIQFSEFEPRDWLYDRSRIDSVACHKISQQLNKIPENTGSSDFYTHNNFEKGVASRNAQVVGVLLANGVSFEQVLEAMNYQAANARITRQSPDSSSVGLSELSSLRLPGREGKDI
jgi:hypothetical protein